jgi:hypothetical protein
MVSTRFFALCFSLVSLASQASEKVDVSPLSNCSRGIREHLRNALIASTNNHRNLDGRSQLVVELDDGHPFQDLLTWNGKSFIRHGKSPISIEKELEEAKANVFFTHVYGSLARSLKFPLRMKERFLAKNSKGEAFVYEEAEVPKIDPLFAYERTPHEKELVSQASVLGKWFEDGDFGPYLQIRRTQTGPELYLNRIAPGHVSVEADQIGFLGHLPGLYNGDVEGIGAARFWAERLPKNALDQFQREAKALGISPKLISALNDRQARLVEAIEWESRSQSKLPSHLKPRSIAEIPKEPKQLMSYLVEQFPELGPLYNRSAGVIERFSVSEHTLRVLKNFEQQLVHFRKELEDARLGIAGNRMLPLLRVSLALHDIGKSLAEKAGNLKLQHEFTLPYLERVLKGLGFHQNEVDLARALIGHDVLGEYMQGSLSRIEALEALKKLANSQKIALEPYLRLQSRIYMMDSASYPMLREGLYDVLLNGELVSRDPRLLSLFHGEAGSLNPEQLLKQRRQMLTHHEQKFESLFNASQGSYDSFVKRMKEAYTSDPRLRSRIQRLENEEIELKVHIWPDSLESIVQHGYLNRSEGGRGSIQSGMSNHQVLVESSFLGIDPAQYHSIPAENRPHYAMLAPKFNEVDPQSQIPSDLPPGYLSRDNEIVENYGPIALILDPHDYREALTLYPGDSANSLQDQTRVRSHTDMKWRQAQDWSQLFVPWKYRMTLAPFLSNVVTRTWSPFVASAPPGYRFSERISGLSNGSVEYIEGQIWKPIRKISAIEVFVNHVKPAQLQKVREIGRRYGIPVRVTDGVHPAKVSGD